MSSRQWRLSGGNNKATSSDSPMFASVATTRDRYSTGTQRDDDDKIQFQQWRKKQQNRHYTNITRNCTLSKHYVSEHHWFVTQVGPNCQVWQYREIFKLPNHKQQVLKKKIKLPPSTVLITHTQIIYLRCSSTEHWSNKENKINK